ncbi:uncharacterized protein [Montipora foliosa]|uniref:uncharacterized protein n=1 Tax=Montipora foliosa TaxID=591990 RepID=UPI0035F126F3
MLAQKEYKRRHDNIARLVHWKLCCKYEHQPEGVVENEKCKILWDMTIQCDHVIEARRPDIVVVEKKNNKAIIVDIASPWDHRVYEKEGEKIEKYQDLKREIGRLWGIRHLEVVPVVVGALGVNHKGDVIRLLNKVAVAYDDNYYVGEIVKASGSTVQVKFLTRSKKEGC